MKTARIAASLALMLAFSLASLTFAQDSSSTDQVFDLGDVLVLEKSGEMAQATTTNVISVDDIEQTGAETVADALEQIPGLDIENSPKMGPTLKLRGFEYEEIKIMIDGVPAHGSYDGYLDLGQIPVDSIAKIEVTKGVSSVLYGANTMGGVINIITKKGPKEPTTSLTSSLGPNSTRNFSASHGGSREKFNYFVAYSYRTSDGYELSGDFDPNDPRTGTSSEYNEDGDIRDLSYYTKNTFNAKVGYDFDTDSRLYLSFDYHDNDRGCPTFQNRYWAFDEWKQWHLNLVGEHDITDKITLKGRVYYVKHDDSLEDVSWDAAHTTQGKKWFERSSYDDYSIGGDFQAYIDISDTNLLKLGATFINDNHSQQDFLDADCFPVIRGWESEGYLPEEKYEASTYSFAIEDEIKLMSERLTLIGGLSYDTLKPEEANGQPVPGNTTSVNPQAGVVFDVDNTFKLHASVGKKTRFPSLKELYSDMAGGNPDLEAQESISYEIGFAKDCTSDFRVSMAVFYNDIENKIDSVKNSDGDKYYINQGESTTKGLEVQIDYLTPFDLEVGLGYTYLQAEDKADADSPELDATFTPEHKLTLDLRYRFDFGLMASAQCIWTGEQLDYYDDDGNEVPISSFTLINARLSQEITLFDKIRPEVFLEIDNLLDKNYDEGNGPAPGRTFLAGARVTF